MEINGNEVKIKDLLKDYQMPDGDDLLFSDDETDILILKEIINKLPRYDLIVLLLYAELGSLRAVAKELDVPHTAITKKMDQIKLQILGKYYEIKADGLQRKIKREIDKENDNNRTD